MMTSNNTTNRKRFFLLILGCLSDCSNVGKNRNKRNGVFAKKIIKEIMGSKTEAFISNKLAGCVTKDDRMIDFMRSLQSINNTLLRSNGNLKRFNVCVTAQIEVKERELHVRNCTGSNDCTGGRGKARVTA